jgi:hypothetical protein
VIRSGFFLVLALALTTLAGPAFAQEEGGGGPPAGGGGGGGGGQSGLPSDINAPRTIPQQFASKLKLDKTQAPAVDQILTAAANQAAPAAAQMLQNRQRMLNALHANNADEAKAAQDAYAASATDIARIEAAAFAKVYALLKPNQQKEAPQAFALLAGLFSNPSTGGPAPGRGRGGSGGNR